jgi:hypothetical protein
MFFGNRRIRSAGRTSGSVEVTLPPQLHNLLEIECRLSLRDGIYPEIVLQPDLSGAHLLLSRLWKQLQSGLASIDEIGDFDPGAFTLALFPPHHWQQRPPLAYADALTVRRRSAASEAREALARLTSSMGIVAGARLGLSQNLALAFGDTLAYLLTGVTTLPGFECERGLAQQLFGGALPTYQNEPVTLDCLWARMSPGLVRVWEQFADWQAAPASHSAARQHWYRVMMIEHNALITSPHHPEA